MLSIDPTPLRWLITTFPLALGLYPFHGILTRALLPVAFTSICVRVSSLPADWVFYLVSLTPVPLVRFHRKFQASLR